MNACVGLCHFCETHGPCAVVVTRAGAPDSEEHGTHGGNGCAACGPPAAVCRSAPYCTGGAPSHLQHLAMRSLSCEVSAAKESSLVFFGDSTKGHVLSYAFQIKDTQARGLKRWFSFIVLMKDKMFLLNITPFLAKQMEEIAKELQSLAVIVFTKDQAVCSQRALRLKNCKTGNEAPRSLIELTGKKNIFAYLHMKFSWMLNSCSKNYSEIVCNNLLPTQERDKFTNSHIESKISLYELKMYLGTDIFLSILYCILTGIQIIIRGDSDMCNKIVYTLEVFLPKTPDCLEYSDYVPPSEARIFSCKNNVAVPKPCSGIFRIDLIKEKPLVHWPGEIPNKWPMLMTNIVKAFNNDLKESTLMHHIKALKAEWLNNATVLKNLNCFPINEENATNLKQTMSIKAEDEELLNYWMLSIL